VQQADFDGFSSQAHSKRNRRSGPGCDWADGSHIVMIQSGDAGQCMSTPISLALQRKSKDEYIRIAKVFAEVASDFGALEIFENWELEVPDGEHTDYRKAVKAEPGEKIVVSWVVWPDRQTGAEAHKGMFADPRMTALGEMPFDARRMILGGFEPIVAYRKSGK